MSVFLSLDNITSKVLSHYVPVNELKELPPPPFLSSLSPSITKMGSSSFEFKTLLDGVLLFVDSKSLQIVQTIGSFDELIGIRTTKDLRLMYYSRATIEQFHIPDKITQWFSKCMNHIPAFYKDKIELSIGGLKVQHTNGNWVTLHANVYPFEGAKDRLEVVCILLREITYMHDSKDVWARISYGGTQPKTFAWHSSEKVKKNKDLLSLREKEILEQVKNRKSNEEIGELLFISKHTVHQHRKNMMARLGAVDSTALVELARMSKLLD